jgi:hypothetical protein
MLNSVMIRGLPISFGSRHTSRACLNFPWLTAERPSGLKCAYIAKSAQELSSLLRLSALCTAFFFAANVNRGGMEESAAFAVRSCLEDDLK